MLFVMRHGNDAFLRLRCVCGQTFTKAIRYLILEMIWVAERVSPQPLWIALLEIGICLLQGHVKQPIYVSQSCCTTRNIKADLWTEFA